MKYLQLKIACLTFYGALEILTFNKEIIIRHQISDNKISRQSRDLLSGKRGAERRVRARHGRAGLDLLPLSDHPVGRDGSARRVDRLAALVHHRVLALRVRRGRPVHKGVVQSFRLQVRQEPIQ